MTHPQTGNITPDQAKKLLFQIAQSLSPVDLGIEWLDK